MLATSNIPDDEESENDSKKPRKTKAQLKVEKAARTCVLMETIWFSRSFAELFKTERNENYIARDRFKDKQNRIQGQVHMLHTLFDEVMRENMKKDWFWKSVRIDHSLRLMLFDTIQCSSRPESHPNDPTRPRVSATAKPPP